MLENKCGCTAILTTPEILYNFFPAKICNFSMKKWLSARQLIVARQQRILLFHFNHHDDAPAGQGYWKTPGGWPKRVFLPSRLAALRSTLLAGVKMNAV